jgi:prevent-host-death family protein
MRKVVGARELKTRLGTYLRQVMGGTTIVVTERGEPVAELRPLRRAASEEERRLEQLLAMGILTRKSKRRLSPFKPVRGRGPSVSQAVIEDREDRF